MTPPKEKAEDLYIKFYLGWLDNGKAVKNKYTKEICLKVVDEILIALPTIPYGIEYLQNRDYYEEVKHEIEKL